MITYENECYIRIILLLLRTGREVIGKVIENVLRSKQMTLDALLILKKEEITVLEFITGQDKVSLFTSSPELSEFSRWDISLLSFIALSYLELSKTERELIEKTKNFWNTYLHISSRSIARDDYTPTWTEIILLFTKYMYSCPLSDEEIKYLNDMTNSVSKQKDMDAAIEDLKNLIPIYGNCTALQKIIEDLEKMKQESGACGVNDDPLSEDGEDLDTSSNSKERNQDYSDFFTVAFQVLLAPTIKFNESQEKDTVVVRFKDDELGGPNSDKHKMEFKRKLPHSLHAEMEYILKIPKSVFEREPFIEYKYYVTRYSTTKTGKGRKPLNDLYYKNGEASDEIYRKLTIPRYHKASYVWHQYDFVVNRKPKKNWKHHVPFIDKPVKTTLEEDAVLSTEVFGRKLLEQFLREKPSSEVVLICYEQTNQLIQGLIRIYVRDAKCFKDYKELINRIGKVFVQELLSSSTISDYLNLRTDLTDEQFKQKMFVCVFVVLVFDKFKFPDMKGSLNDLYHKICLAFRITPEKEKRTCKEFKFLQRYFKEEQTTLVNGFRSLCTAVVKQTTQTKDPSWLYVVPLIHFLSGVCKPYIYGGEEDTQTESLLDNSNWWGVSVVYDAFLEFQTRVGQNWIINPSHVLAVIEPLFEIDYLLPRVLMRSLNLEDVQMVISTNKISCEVSLAVLSWHLISKKTYNKKSDEQIREDVEVFQCLGLLTKRFKDELKDCSNSLSESKWRLCHRLSKMLIKSVCDRSLERYVPASNSSRVYLMSTVLYQMCLNQNRSEELSEITATTLDISDTVVDYLRKYYSDWNKTSSEFVIDWNSHLKAWDAFVMSEEDLNFDKHELVKDWNKSITEEMEKNLEAYILKRESEGQCRDQQCKEADSFIKFYCNDAYTFKKTTQTCLRRTALKVYRNRYLGDFIILGERGKTEYLALMSDLFLEEWNKHESDDTNNREFLRLILKWRPFNHIAEIYLAKRNMCQLNDICCKKLETILDEIGTLSDSLLKGTLKVRDLKIISDFVQTFADIKSMKPVDEIVPKQMFEQAVKVRNKELEAYEKKANDVVALVKLCSTIPKVDVNYLRQELSERVEIQNHTFSKFCDPEQFSKESDHNSVYKPNITAFQLPDGVEEILSDVCELQKSSVFMKIWDEILKSTELTSLDELPRIWKLAEAEWTTWSTRIKVGDILFRDFETKIGSENGGDYAGIHEELKRLKLPAEIAKIRVQQLTNYRHLETCKTGARVILQLKQEIKLEGDFQQLQKIAAGDNSELKMIQFDESFMDTCSFLSDFSEDRLKCIETFLKCQPIVEWLKTSMPTYKEIQVFIELASMSVGDNAFNIGKVQALNAAVTGYAPLIFEMEKKSDSKPIPAILDLCRAVWKELDANHKLPEQLENINHELNWLQEIQRSHGSVEVSTMLQTQTINSLGIYTVGKQASDGVKTQENRYIFNSRMLEIGDTIKLTVRDQWEMVELKAVQTRLMRVTDKAALTPEHKETIKKNIADVVDLMAREIEKKKEHNHFVRSDLLNLKERLDHMTEKMELNSELKAQLKRDISNVIEHVLREKSQISKHYTFSDLLDLQSRVLLMLGKAEQGRENIDTFIKIFDSITRLGKIYVKLNCNGCLLFKDFSARFNCDTDPNRPGCVILQFSEHDELSTLTGQLSGREDLADMVREIANFMETCLMQWMQNIKKKRKQYQQLNFFTINQLVILQTELAKVATDEGPSCLIYPLLSAVKKDCNEGDVVNSVKEAKRTIDEMIRSNTSDEDITLDTEDKQFISDHAATGINESLARKAIEHVSLKDKTQGLEWCMAEANKERQSWSFTGDIFLINDLLRQDSDVGVKHLIHTMEEIWKRFETLTISASSRNYISLDHLGIILQNMSTRDSRTIPRSLPNGLKHGCPNLIVCPYADVITTTLTIYMSEKEQHLPQSDEVMLCTTDTSVDEVEIFLRRVFNGPQGKLHCFVNADLLSYDVCDAAQKRIEEYLDDLKTTDARYQFVIICSIENSNRSGMVSFLEKFRRERPNIDITNIKVFIENHLKGGDIEDFKPACSLDITLSTVRVLKSTRAGVGKTLFKLKMEKKLQTLNKEDVNSSTVSIPLQGQSVDMQYVSKKLLKHVLKPSTLAARIFHIDISHEVQDGVDFLLFYLLILGYLVDHRGYVWRKSPLDLYLIETMPIMISTKTREDTKDICLHTLLQLLPDMTCISPLQCQDIYSSNKMGTELLRFFFNPSPQSDQKQLSPLFDETELQSEKYKNPYKYLKELHERKPPRSNVSNRIQAKDCLELLIRYCGIKDPSWSELHHFVVFLHTQLKDFENNSFVSKVATQDLPGFSQFVLRFLVQMSKDFSTRSLQISEETPNCQYMQTRFPGNENNIFQNYEMKRKWESSPHAYVFFNRGGDSFTFLGFNINKDTLDLIDEQTNKVIEEKIMDKKLYDSLLRNGVQLKENFHKMDRSEKLMKLRLVMGLTHDHDPDTTYELTTDNVKKIMAIYMRFRCDIPVIVMGETGCGKTRMVQYLSAIQLPPGANTSSMVLMKVHGGTTNKDIITAVRKAENLAVENSKKYGDHVYTILFFDEVNSTSSIGLIKEIMCDKTIEGEKLELCTSLKFVAACNPYRKHSDKVIKKLEEAGLGYHVHADDTTDRLGKIPMRRLVYRVQPLSQSLLPLVWDFGKLDSNVEILYIKQMVMRYESEQKLPAVPGSVDVISEIIAASQQFMRDKTEEGSFVSLRDVNRVLIVMSWFYQQGRILFDLMNKKMNGSSELDVESARVRDNSTKQVYYSRKEIAADEVTRSLILALGICYHACLKKRELYLEHIAKFFRSPCGLTGGSKQIFKEIDCCQDVFLDNVDLGKNISRNLALKENVFMMIVCIELRIPLFVIGKPGSSKSLAKAVVIDAMRGNTAKNSLLKRMKKVKMISYQCSPLATPEGIVGVFREAAGFQKDNKETFVSVVVLDEVGLAEDSPKMPLKTLHPLLEDGCVDDGEPADYKKVAFIGISNWSLDPAKMNRGIVVQRDVPDLDELINTARGICERKNNMERLMRPMAISYLELFEKAKRLEGREFFGLRDFYSLVKMACGLMKKSDGIPEWHKILHAVKRNFGGLERVDPVESFKKNLAQIMPVATESGKTDRDHSAAKFINECIAAAVKINSSCTAQGSMKEEKENFGESRYLLLLVEKFGSLSVVQQLLLRQNEDNKPVVIFGSRFRRDQDYTQVCRNINKIKLCMETGKLVILLNLENLYESLYDALNQYYSLFGGMRYVDLGLGTHRVKCPVHENFRLIVLAEKQTVYKQFPIPLINRFEKHCFSTLMMLEQEQKFVVVELEHWAKQLTKTKSSFANRQMVGAINEMEVGDIFIGYHEDMFTATVFHVWDNHVEKMKRAGSKTVDRRKVIESAKDKLLWCVTPDAIIRQGNTHCPPLEWKIYFERQTHNSLQEFLHSKLVEERCEELFAQVTTHSKLLTDLQRSTLSNASGIEPQNVLILKSLTSFDTEQQFTEKIENHIKRENANKSAKLIIIQCECGDENEELIACSRHIALGEWEKMIQTVHSYLYFVIIVQLPNVAGGCFKGFQCGKWQSVHIDDLGSDEFEMPPLTEMHGKTIGGLFSNAISSTDIMDQPERVTKKYKATKKLDVRKLILECIQLAVAKVKYKPGSTETETARAYSILRLFHEDYVEGNTSFVQSVCCLVANILSEKEQKYGTSDIAKFWLEHEAALPTNINKAGTFRNACMFHLERKLSPVIAVIIAFLDTNANFALLYGVAKPWKKSLWLSVISTPGAIDIKCNYFMAPMNNTQAEEMFVVSTGSGERDFKLQMPFSWLIMDTVNEILKNQVPSTDEAVEVDTPSTVQSSYRVLKDSPLGAILEGITDEKTIGMVIDDYLNDFMHTMYSAASDLEFKLVFTEVHFVMDHCLAGLHSKRLLTRVINVHLAFGIVAQRLNYFREINMVWKECSECVDLAKKEKTHQTFSNENDLTTFAIYLLLEKLTSDGVLKQKTFSPQEWLENIYRYRPVIEAVITFYNGIPSSDFAVPSETIHKIKKVWGRVVVMKLFIQNFCLSENEPQTSLQLFYKLWEMVDEKRIVSMDESLGAVETFLQYCHKETAKHLNSVILKCSFCNTIIENESLVLPCKCFVCKVCVRDIQGPGEKKCFVCHSSLPAEWTPVQNFQKSQAEELLKVFTRKCNAFFMDFVSQMCFADEKSPSDTVVQKLLTYIWCKSSDKQRETKSFSPLSSGYDHRPIFRSFLLQIVLQTSEQRALDHLEQYFSELSKLCSADIEHVQLCVLVIQCLEDKLLSKMKSPDVDKLSFATVLLKTAGESIFTRNLTINKLYGIARVKVGLAQVAAHVFDIVREESTTKPEYELLYIARSICRDSYSRQTRLYLKKVFCRYYGMEVYWSICRSDEQDIKWIVEGDKYNRSEMLEERRDRYIVAGKEYKQISHSIIDIIMGGDADKLVQHCENSTDPLRTEYCLRLAIHREITCSTKDLPLTVETLKAAIGTSGKIKDKKHLKDLLDNNLKPKRIHCLEGQGLYEKGITCLIFHFWAAIECTETRFLKPLHTLMTRKSYTRMYLPTMPYDDMEDVKSALLQSELNLKFYNCPQGHPYSVGECGQPMVKSNCNVCGAEIGGTQHRLLASNKAYVHKKRSMRGHILGCAENRRARPTSVRDMTPAESAILRLLVHMAMFIGVGKDCQIIQRTIKPKIKVDEVEMFVWNHIKTDLNEICMVFGRNQDDVFVFMHYIVEGLAKPIKSGLMAAHIDFSLLERKDRDNWENTFTKTYLKKHIKDVDTILDKLNTDIMNDKRIGNNHVLYEIYESPVNTDDSVVEDIRENPRAWRYRTPISLEHLRHTLEANASLGQKYEVLQLFVTHEHNLRALKYIPGIIRLQRALFKKYQYKLSSTEASCITIQQLISENAAGIETQQLIRDFADAWELVREDLKKHVCRTPNGSMVVEIDICDKKIEDSTPLPILLPTIKRKNYGLCSFALLDFLFRKQNDFLDKYARITNRTTDTTLVISPMEVTSAHLITFDFQHDLLPLLMANCQYSFEMGQGTKMEFDFASMERQLMDRFLFSKSRIDVGSDLKIDLMIFRTEMTNATVFEQLGEKIKQESLNTLIKAQICQEMEMEKLQDICKSLHNLDIAISILRSSGCQNCLKIHDFMKEKLLMKETLCSGKAREICQIKHAESLWLLMALQKSKVMTNQKQSRQNIFETIPASFHENMAENELSELRKFIADNISLEKLTVFVEILHDFILLKVSDNLNAEEENSDPSEKKIKDWLSYYISEREVTILDDATLSTFPESLKYIHIVHVWTETYLILTKKQSALRR